MDSLACSFYLFIWLLSIAGEEFGGVLCLSLKSFFSEMMKFREEYKTTKIVFFFFLFRDGAIEEL